MLNTLIYLLVALSASHFSISMANDADSRIWNGKTATAGQFPFQAFLSMSLNGGGNAFCGGSLANENYVLTAAHCCVNVTSIKVHLGIINIKDAQADFVQRFDVPSDRIIVHESYDPNTIANDICLLHLPSAAQLNANVSVITLPSQQDTKPSQYDFKRARVSGFGQTNDLEGVHPNLQWATVPLQPHSVCSAIYTFINKVSTSQLCSGKLYLNGPCRGDSGGPLTVPDANGTHFEVGIVSWGVGGCVGLAPVVYTYVPAFYDWLQKNMV